MSVDELRITSEQMITEVRVQHCYAGGARTKFLGMILAVFPNHYYPSKDTYTIQIPSELTMAYIWGLFSLTEKQKLCEDIQARVDKKVSPAILALMRISDVIDDLTNDTLAQKQAATYMQQAAYSQLYNQQYGLASSLGINHNGLYVSNNSLPVVRSGSKKNP